MRKTGVGKTSLLMSYAGAPFSMEDVPKVFSGSLVPLLVNSCSYYLSLWDTGSDKDLRVRTYDGVSVFLIAYAIDDPLTLEHVKTRWMPEIMEESEIVPIILIGTKLDRREDSMYVKYADLLARGDPVYRQDGERVAEEIGAYASIECSVITELGVQSAFFNAVKSVLEFRGKKEKGMFSKLFSRFKGKGNANDERFRKICRLLGEREDNPSFKMTSYLSCES